MISLLLLKKKKKLKNKFCHTERSRSVKFLKSQIPVLIGVWDFLFFKESSSTECVFDLHPPQLLLLEHVDAISLLHSHRKQNLL